MFSVYLMRNGWLVSTKRFNNWDDAHSFAMRYVKGRKRNSVRIVWSDKLGMNIGTL